LDYKCSTRVYHVRVYKSYGKEPHSDVKVFLYNR